MDFTFHPGNSTHSAWVEFYPYTPSASAGYGFMALFGITTIVHFVMMFPYRAAYFIPLVLGVICETFGYYGRAWSHQSRTEIGSWALQEMLLMCAPPLITATIYMFLGRIMRSLNAEHHSSIRIKWLTPLFVLNDTICFITQIGGAGVQVTGDANVMAIGVKVVLAGLVLSLVVFCLFVLIAAKFHRRLDAEPTSVLNENPSIHWKRYMWALYTACFAVMLRNLIRTIQFGSNKNSPLNTKEAFIYVFDAFPMLVTVLVLIIFHPGQLIKKGRRAQQANHLYEGMRNSDVPLTGYKGPC